MVVNAAAYTAVDRAETEPDLAWRVNADAAGEAADAAQKLGAAMIQISTDYVLNAVTQQALDETVPIDPINHYGASKAAGEAQVLAAHPEAMVIRTSWVISQHPGNFLTTMLRLASERDVVRVVADQHGCPTSATDLAHAVLELAGSALSPATTPAGVYHLANAGSTTWAGLAAEIFAASARHGGPFASVEPISSEEYPLPAARPKWSVLQTDKIKQTFGIQMPPWRDSVESLVSLTLAGAAPS